MTLLRADRRTLARSHPRVAVKEGIETWRGEGCCAPPDLTAATATSHDDCCA